MQIVQESGNNDNNAVQEIAPPPPPLDVSQLTKPTLQHRLRIQKLLQLRTPAEDYRAFMAQTPNQIAKDLFGVNLNLTFDTWLSHITDERNFVRALSENVWLHKQYIREILLFTTISNLSVRDFQKIIGPCYSHSYVNNPRVFIELLEVDYKDFICSWSVKQRLQFLSFMFKWIVHTEGNQIKEKLRAFIQLAFCRDLVRDFSTDQLVELFTSNKYFHEDFEDNSKLDTEGIKRKNHASIMCILTSEVTTQKFSINLYNGEAVTSNFVQLKKHSDNCKFVSKQDWVKIIQVYPMVVLDILQFPEYLPIFTANYLYELAKTNLLFSVEIISKIRIGELKFFPDQLLYQIAHNNISEYDSFLANATQKGLNLGTLETSEWWILARLIFEGLNGDPDLLFKAACIIPAENYADKSYINQLLITAYESGNLNAGMRLADHLWNGRGIFPNQSLALDIYHDICQLKPELLTVDALDRITEEKLINFMGQYAEFTSKLTKLIELKQTVVSNTNSKLISALKSSLQNSNLTKLHPKINLSKRTHELENEIETLAEQLMAAIEPIVSLPLADNPLFQNHLPWLTTHMLMLRVLIEQKDMIQDTPSWLAAFERSIKCAWNYDTLENTDPELVTILKRIKEMYKSTKYATAIGSIKLEQHIQTHQERFFKPVNDDVALSHDANQTRPVKSRSLSMPDLTFISGGK